MKLSTFTTAALLLLGTIPFASAATPPAMPGLSSPLTPASTAAPIATAAPTPKAVAPHAQLDMPHVTTVAQAVPTTAAVATAPHPASAALIATGGVAPVAPTAGAATDSPSRASLPNGRPTLGDWQDLADRQAFSDQTKKLDGSDGKQAQNLPPQPPAYTPPHGPQPQDDTPKKPRRVNEACQGDGACFYAVYGMHIEGGPNNYHGLLAIDGLVEAVYKGKQFVTPHGRYTLKDISTHELSYADGRGRVHTVPFSGEADVQADPAELKADQKPANQPVPFAFPMR
jgi:hypothetical protein